MRTVEGVCFIRLSIVIFLSFSLIYALINHKHGLRVGIRQY